MNFIDFVDIPDESFRIISKQIFRFSVPLVKLFHDPPGVETLEFLGGGTLVKIEDNLGLLTAHHVAKELVGGMALGLILSEEEDNFHIPLENLEIIDIATPVADEVGPDLAFIRLRSEDCERISASKEFFVLDDVRDELLTSPPSIDSGIWSICGPPRESIRQEDSSRGADFVAVTQLFCGFGVVEPEESVNDFDYFRMSTEYASGQGVPRSSKGMSGGGLWQIPITIHPDKHVTAKRYLLSGVNFWRQKAADGKIYARSHGRKSVYLHAYNTVLKKCA